MSLIDRPIHQVEVAKLWEIIPEEETTTRTLKYM